MNVLNNISDEVVECPLCMEPLEVDDLSFFPCTCGYQICRFCWHRIRTDENELCPACRKAYPENPADFKPLSQEQIAALKAEKRQRDQQRKQKITENRKHLANVRVVQKNLVFVVGLPPRLADADILKKHEYFGKYGKIHKVVINPSTTYAGVQGPSASAYVTYVHNNDALRAIQNVNNIMIDGRLVKTSLGTTKYCSHFMKNQQCPKADCMYLHELGDSEASFTKEEMHQGKHQEYEKRLHEALIAATNGNSTTITTNIKNGDKLTNGTGPVQSKEAWPSLSVSPVNKEPTKGSGKAIGKENGSKNNNNNENRKHDKTKGDKRGQKKLQNNSTNHNNNNNNKIENCNITNGLTNGNNHNSTTPSNQQNGIKDTNNSTGINDMAVINEKQSGGNKQQQQQQQQQLQKQQQQLNHINVDDEIKLIEDHLEKNMSLSEDNDGKNADTRSISSSSSNNSSSDNSSLSESTSGKSSPGSFPDHAIPTSTSPTADTLHNNLELSSLITSASTATTNTTSAMNNKSASSINNKMNSMQSIASTTGTTTIATSTAHTTITNGNIMADSSRKSHAPQTNGETNNIINTSDCLSKLCLFDDNSSFFSCSSFQPLLKGKLDNESRTTLNNQLNNVISSQLPDLLNGTSVLKCVKQQKGIDGYQNQQHPSPSINSGGIGGSNNGSSLIDSPEKYFLSFNTTEDWEAAFKYVMMRNNKQLEDQQEEYLRMQEIQKRNNLINSIGGMSQMNGGGGGGIHDFNTNDFHNGTDINRLSQAAMFPPQQPHRQPNNMHQNDHILGNSLFGTNMSKFFDFHKNQQQQQQQFMMNGHVNNLVNDPRDQISMATLLENNRINSQYLDHTNGLIGQQLQKQRLLNKYDQMGTHNHNMLINPNNGNNQQQQNRIPNQFSQNPTVDDDLGFDPFIETQKALAELMENENVQQQLQNGPNKHLLDNCQRSRMPPPGFNHMNAFGFGVPRAQGSKILPFMNMTNNSNQQQQTPQNNWVQHMGFPQQPPPQLNDQIHMGPHSTQNSNQHNKSGYGNMSDWTAMDPAILSFRQFPSYSSHQQQQQQQQQQHTPPDMFMQHLTQNIQQSGQGYGHHGVNLPNNILNPQQNSPAQVNYSNWLNTEQSMFMNSLANGYSSNYDKFSIPMPPGIHSNNLNSLSGSKQQKTECIN